MNRPVKLLRIDIDLETPRDCIDMWTRKRHLLARRNVFDNLVLPLSCVSCTLRNVLRPVLVDFTRVMSIAKMKELSWRRRAQSRRKKWRLKEAEQEIEEIRQDVLDDGGSPYDINWPSSPSNSDSSGYSSDGDMLWNLTEDGI